jgi:hypothetical protein
LKFCLISTFWQGVETTIWAEAAAKHAATQAKVANGVTGNYITNYNLVLCGAQRKGDALIAWNFSNQVLPAVCGLLNFVFALAAPLFT